MQFKPDENRSKTNSTARKNKWTCKQITKWNGLELVVVWDKTLSAARKNTVSEYTNKQIAVFVLASIRISQSLLAFSLLVRSMFVRRGHVRQITQAEYLTTLIVRSQESRYCYNNVKNRKLLFRGLLIFSSQHLSYANCIKDFTYYKNVQLDYWMFVKFPPLP